MNICETEAIVLHTTDFGESDRLISFYTRAGGRLKGIAKGARRSQKRFVHAFEPGSLVRLTYRSRKSLIWVEACKLQEPHLALRTEVERWGYAALASEFVLELAPEGDPQEDVFHLLNGALDRLCEDKDPLNVVLLFMIRFLDLMGYLPSLEGCGICGRPLKGSTRWWWRLGHGGIDCGEHHSGVQDHLLLDLGTMVLIQQARRLPLGRVWRLHIRRDKKLALLHGFVGWMRTQTGRDLKSLRLLQQVQSA